MGHKKNKHQPKGGSKKGTIFEEKRPSDPPEVIVEEGLAFQELISKSRQNLNGQDKFCYLLSTKWYASWKQYTGYEDLIKGQDPQKSKYFGKKKPGKINTDIIGKNDKNYKIPEELPEYEYLDIVLDEETAKDKDFIVIDSQSFTFLYEKYEGNIFKRPLRKRKSGPYFDTHLHSFYVLFLSPQQMEKIMDASDGQLKRNSDSYLQIKKMQVSSLWGVSSFKEFLVEYINVTQKMEKEVADLKVWKWQSFLSFKQIKHELIEALRTASYKITARKLDEEEQNDWDLDDIVKESCVVFVQYNGINFERGPLPEQITGYCEECIKSHKLTEKCPCGKVFYCSVQCRYDDKAYHFRTCSNAYQSSDDEEYLEKKVDTKKRPSKCGLRNLGNTCYMNSSLQCLANIPEIADYFCSNRYLDHLNKKQVEENNAIFIKKFAKFVKKLYQNDEYEPWSIKMQISYYISIFKGYQQHDANDFIVYLVNNLNDFSSKPEHENFSELIANTFLGQFDSVVNCPECTTTSKTKDPFLEVSVPLKPKVPVKEIHYCIIIDWKTSIKGVCEAKETWEQVCSDIGVKEDQYRKMVGTEKSDLQQIIEDNPEDTHRKHRKQTVFFYPKQVLTTKETTVQIPIAMAYIKVLSGNEMKCYYGNPVFINVVQTKYLHVIYEQIASAFQVGPQNLQLLQSYIIKCQGEYQALIKSQEERDDQREKGRKEKEELRRLEKQQKKEEEVKEEKKIRDQERKRKQELNKAKDQQKKEKQREIAEFSARINEQFQATYATMVGFRVFIKSYRKSKRACVYCGKKCSGCLLPFSITKTVQQYINLTDDDFKLEIVFDSIPALKQETRVTKFNQYTTVEECLVEFSKPEQLDQQNAWYCQVCSDMRLAYKQLKIDRYPKTLAIQLKRFKQQHGKKVKNNEVIWYPEIFEAAEGIKYQLNSVIVHEGSLQGGHYWAICRKGEKYFSFNDEKVREERDHFSKSAYILFYSME